MKDPKVTRFEVVSGLGGRIFSRSSVNVELSYQDDGRTLKVFLNDSNVSKWRVTYTNNDVDYTTDFYGVDFQAACDDMFDAIAFAVSPASLGTVVITKLERVR